jgi:RNA polymerase sigma-70 factor (ECF subfamily)
MDDNHYISEVIAGNTASFAVLIDRHKDLVFTIAMNITHNHEDAEEVAQDAFLKAFQKLAGFRKESSFQTWLYRIAYNEAISRVRRNKVKLLDLEEEVTGNIPEEEVEEDVAGLDEQEQKLVVTKIPALFFLEHTEGIHEYLFTGIFRYDGIIFQRPEYFWHLDSDRRSSRRPFPA